MSWNNDDGPWGPSGDKSNKPKQASDGGDPWTQRNPGPGGQPGPFAPPPDLDELLDKIKKFFAPYKPQSHKQAIGTGLAVIGALWLLSGLYQVSSDQVGVVMRFGAYDRTEQPGLRYHLPAPIESVTTPVVTSQNEIQVGFRRAGRSGDDARYFPEESMMLTQDENIINVQFTVFWRISDVGKFMFEIREPETTIKMAAESVMRDVIGQNKLQFALTDGRSEIAEEAQSRLQALMDEYNAGIIVSQINLQTVSVPDEVRAAFQDVVNARLDQERFQNQAAAHANKVVPDAKGQATQFIQQAMGYRDQKIAIAQGDADRFKEVLQAYNLSREVTTKRLYLETMESILRDARKVVVQKSGVVPYLPVQDLLRQPANEGGKQ